MAIAAAQEGARAATAENGRTSDGISAAHAFIADAGGDDVLIGPYVSGSRTATVATVRVVGNSMGIVPGWTPVVPQSAPRSRWTG